jgi:hypothetical protein
VASGGAGWERPAANLCQSASFTGPPEAVSRAVFVFFSWRGVDMPAPFGRRHIESSGGGGGKGHGAWRLFR